MRYFMTFSYDGSAFSGYQKQIKERTIQGEIEKALTKINGDISVSIHASGRTDAGVHAYNQKAHFDLDKEMDLSKLKYSLNSLLPDDIYIRGITIVADDFHARFDALEKTYHYVINMGEYLPVSNDYIYNYGYKLILFL